MRVGTNIRFGVGLRENQIARRISAFRENLIARRISGKTEEIISVNDTQVKLKCKF